MYLQHLYGFLGELSIEDLNPYAFMIPDTEQKAQHACVWKGKS